MKRDSIGVLIGAFIAVLAQIIIAPNIAVFSAMPNFLLVYALVIAILRPQNTSSLVLAFVCGLLYDLLGSGPVGAMAFLMVLTSSVASRVFVIVNNDTIFMPLMIFAVATLFVETVYAIFMITFGVSVSPLDAFLYRVLPCFLYDCIFGAIFYFLASRFLVGSSRAASSSKGGSSRASVQVSAQSQPRVKRSKKKTFRF